jgi:HD-GYP domain-containing protein (c-di-GMP phosphodiesterase class II)
MKESGARADTPVLYVSFVAPDLLEDPVRLGAVRRLRLLNAPSTPSFDRLASLARRAFSARLGSLSLVEADRAFLLASDGLPARLASEDRLVPAAITFAQDVVRRGAPRIVDDTRTIDSEAARSLERRGCTAYCGVPLATADQVVVGVLAVADAGPRQWKAADLDVLRDLAASVMTEIELHARQHREVGYRDELEILVQERTALLEQLHVRLRRSEQALRASREHAIQRLSRAIELRNDETGWHVDRMARSAAALGARAGLPAERCELLRLAAPLHDIGKIAIPDHVLLKQGRFTARERTIMQGHAELGHRMLAGPGEEILELAATVAHTHHERVDGQGYPRRLRGAEIPVEGRIAAIADTFDALTSDRPYREALSVDAAVETMLAERGSHFDSDLLDLFLSSLPDGGSAVPTTQTGEFRTLMGGK